MTARELLDELLHLHRIIPLGQGQARIDKQARAQEIIDQLYEIADEYDRLQIVDICPDRDNPDHWKVDCWLCDHEGFAFLPPTEKVGEVSHTLTPSLPGSPPEGQAARQLDMFEDRKEE